MPLAVWGLDGQGVEPFSRSKTLVAHLAHQRPLLEHVYEFDPDQRVVGRCKRLESEHGTGDAFDGPVILFDEGFCQLSRLFLLVGPSVYTGLAGLTGGRAHEVPAR